MNPSTEKLAAEIEEVEWHWLRPHLARGAVIVVATGIDLAEAAGRIAADDTVIVDDWIASEKLTRPSAEQIEAWNADPARRFPMLIVQPFVLIQESRQIPAG